MPKPKAKAAPKSAKAAPPPADEVEEIVPEVAPREKPDPPSELRMPGNVFHRCEREFEATPKNEAGYAKEEDIRKTLKRIGFVLPNEDVYKQYVRTHWTLSDENATEQLCLEELQHLVNDLYCSTVQFGTELRTVCGRGENDRARELVVRGCKPNAVDGRGWNAVHHAAEYGQASTIEMLVELLEEELELDKQDNRGWTPLAMAASNGHADTVRALLKYAADVDEPSQHGRTPLFQAAANGYAECCSLLLVAGADVTAKDAAGWTPLYVAAIHGHEGVLKVLVEAGADTTARDVLDKPVEAYCNERTRTVLAAAIKARAQRPASPRSPRA